MEREADCEPESTRENKISVYVAVKGHLCIANWLKASLLLQTVQISIRK